MKKTLIIYCIFFYFSAFAQSEQRIIVKLKPGISITKEALLHNTTGIKSIDKINSDNDLTVLQKLRIGKRNFGNFFVFTFPKETNSEAVMNAFRNTGVVEYTEKDFIGTTGGVKAVTSAPNDSFYDRQWGLNNNGSFNMFPAVSGADIQIQDAWDIQQGSNSIVVATMDSGLKLDHPEFEGRLWINTLEIPNNGIDDDDNGYIDDINGWDFANEDNDPTDDHGHGTNVTGIIAANGNNGIGYSGIDSNCRLMTLKGINATNFGYYTWWAEAILYAADNGADVINLSVGGNSQSSLLAEAIAYAIDNNVAVVACMMNTNNNVTYYPAAYPNVIAVGATNPDDTRTSPFFWDLNSGSNYGNHISVVAPGNFIYGLSYASDSDYETYWGGTSQATPAVTGIVSLMKAQNPSQTPADIKYILEVTAEDQVGNSTEDIPGFDIYYGHGRVNAYDALQLTVLEQDEKKKIVMSIFPNPSPDGNINIVLENYPAKITVHNMLGQLIAEEEIQQNNKTITVKEKGIFLVTVKNEKGTDSGKIIIK